MKMLTIASVQKLKCSKGRREVPDAGARGLYLVIQASGTKSWAMRFRRPGGKSAKLTLGSCDVTGSELEGEPQIGGHLTLPAARRLASDIQRQRAMGKDVISDREAEKQRVKFAVTDAQRDKFAAAARDYVEQWCRDEKKNRGWIGTAKALGLRYEKDNDVLLMKGGLAERWADRPVAAITSTDVRGIIREARLTAVPGRRARTEGPSGARARQMASALSGMFGWLQEEERIASDPTAGMRRPEPSGERERVLTSDELRKLWLALNTLSEPFGRVIKLLLLTGQRRSEVAGMRWSELSDDGTWTLPDNRTKNKKTHAVPLAPMARELIGSEVEDPKNPIHFVFTTNGRSPVSGFGKIKARLDQVLKIPEWKFHDLRRTAYTGMAEMGIAPNIIEACVNHVSGHKGGLAGIYNRAEYATQKRTALERWAGHVGAIVSGRPADKVVQMRGKHA
jgi:integrase